MSLGKKNIPSIIPDKESFFLWYELGSITKVRRHFQNQGKINPRTSKQYSAMGIWFAAKRYILENLDEAWEYYQKDGYPKSKEDFLAEQVLSAMTVYGRSSTQRFYRWIHENHLERFSYLYKDKFPSDPLVYSNNG